MPEHALREGIGQDAPVAAAPLRSEQLSRHLLEKLPAGAYTCDAEGLITYYNPNAVRLWGRVPKLHDPADRFCGSFKLYTTDGSPIAHDQCWMALALREEKEYNGHEIVIERPDGQHLTVLAHASPLHDESGVLIGAVNVLVDISDRKRAEEALGDREARLRILTNTVPSLVWVCDAEGQAREFNERWHEYTGLTYGESAGAGWTTVLHPDDAARVLATWRDARARGASYAVDARYRRHDGEHRWFIARAEPLRDATGRIVAWFGTSTDIHDQKRAEEALREEARLVATLQRIGQSLTSQLELDGLLQAVTDAATELTGAGFGALFYNAVDERGESYQLFTLSGAPREAFENFPMPRNTPVFEPTFRGTGVVRSDDIIRDPRYGRMDPHHGMPEGHLPVRSYLAVPVVSRTGEVLGGLFFGHEETGVFTEKHERLAEGVAGWAAVAIDNARLYDAERREHAIAVAANRAKSDFLAVMSHELRTPLNAIIGYGDILLAGVAGPISGKHTEYLDRIRAAAWHQLQLINQILSLSKIEAGKEDLDRKHADVVALVREAAALVRPQAEAKGLALRVRAPKNPLVLATDHGKLRQILLNLLSNAVRFTEVGGVELRLVARRGALLFQVRDTGAGIAPDERERIFEAFTQVDQGPTRRTGGTGLGLAICRHLARLLGGDVTVESEVGSGSTFTLRLPREQEP